MTPNGSEFQLKQRVKRLEGFVDRILMLLGDSYQEQLQPGESEPVRTIDERLKELEQ